MKFSVILTLLIIFITSTITIQAHDKEKHGKTRVDTVRIHEAEQMDNVGHTTQMATTHDMSAYKKEKASFDAFPTLHPLVVHFPIVLLLLALLAQIAGFFVFKKELGWITLILAFGGLAGAYVAGQLLHPHTTGLTETAAWLLDQHEKYADYTLWTALAAFLLKALSMFIFRKRIWIEIIVLIVLGISAYTVSETGHYGAQLLHIEGVGAKGDFIEKPESENNHSHNH